jgi:RNA polymerase sigma-70 factor, ECF subfamily
MEGAGEATTATAAVHSTTTTEKPSVAESSSPEVSDVDLLRQAAAGDGRAFHQLVDRHGDRLFRLSVSLIGNSSDAEDVVQETFAGAFKGLRQFEGRASVKTWLTRILFTQAAKWRRDRRRRRDTRPIEPDEAQASVPGQTAGVEARIDLHAALARLSDEHREVLMLREFEGMAYEEMAEVLGVPRGTVESRLHRARGELREKLKSYGVDLPEA